MKIPRLILFIVLITDAIAFNLAWWLYYWVRSAISPDFILKPELLWLPTLVMTFYWVLLFFISGLYQIRMIVSRFDEFIQIIKTTFVGSLIVSFLIFLDESRISAITDVRLVIFLYWAILTSLVVVFRISIRTIQRKLLIAGILARRTVVVGSGKKAIRASENILKYPALGFRFLGFIRSSEPVEKLDPLLGNLAFLRSLVQKNEIDEIIIAPESNDPKLVVDVLTLANPPKVSVKIIPDLYDVISGQARTNQIYGFPLIDLNPHYFTPLERFLKRSFDVFISILLLFLTLPITLITAIVIKLESDGPVFFKQERVGKDGIQFFMYKFRSMVQNAEKATGPTWAQKGDPRITAVGRFIRKYRIDEIPQFINVLKGEMSAIGPRPERQFFIDKLKNEVPFYERRLRVKPGITGLAQVKHKYDTSIDDVYEKVKYDLYYIENMSFKMDVTILFHTVFTLLGGKGQ